MTNSSRMSLLREAERCLSNQSSRKFLNALITGVKNEDAVFKQAREAEARQVAGKIGCVHSVADCAKCR